MTYESLVKKLATSYKDADASAVNEHVALQFNIFGEGEGALYLEIADGKVNVQPYEYYDRDAIVTCDATAFTAFASGKLNLIEGNETGKVRVEGNLDKVSKVALVKKKEAKKPATAKKPAAKKVAAQKAAVKNEVKKVEKKIETKKAEVKAEVKEAVKKIELNPVVKKMEAKPVEKKAAPAKAEVKAADKKPLKK